MSDTSQNPDPLSRTVFPFPKPGGDASDPSRTTEASAREYFQALSQAEDGFFPIGYNGQWHGGIHFGKQTEQSLAQEAGIRCIADGQVIAYRIDKDYPTVEYESCAPATYSKGFVLVRHRLQLPPAPQAADGDNNAAAAPNTEPSLLLYSLYMHLRNSAAYTTDTDLARPAFWDGSVYRVGQRAVDGDRNRNPLIPESGGTGMNIRDGNHRISGFASRGAKLRLGAANPAHGSFYQITEVVAGTTYPDNVVGMYVYKGTDTSREGLDPVSRPHTTDTIYIPPDPIQVKAGDLVGHLGEYQRYMDMDAMSECAAGRPLAQVDVFTHEDLRGFIAQGRARDAQLETGEKTLLHIKPGARLVQPSEPDLELANDQAVILSAAGGEGLWVKGQRGTIATTDTRPGGFNAATRAYGDGRVFVAAVDAAGNELAYDQFNALGQAEKATYSRRKLLTPTGGDEVWVLRGSANNQSLVPAPARVWSRFPLQVASAGGEAVAHARVVPVSVIEDVVQETDDIRWFRVEAGTSTGGMVIGWVRGSGHANVELCSPWAWPGFELFDVGELEPRELFARELNNSRRAQPQEREEFGAAARSVEQSPLFDALGRAIDADGDHQITPLELREAMGKSWLAQAISRLVIRYPSEWSDPTDRWSRIDDLIKDETLLKDWQHEKSRIQQLVIWPEVAGQHGFPSDSTVHHLHPVGFVENFSRNRRVSITLEMLQQIFTTAPEDRLQSIVDEINQNIEDYRLDTALRLSHFFAQVREEVGGSASFTESLNYTPAGLVATFGYFSGSPQEARIYGRVPGQAANQEAIANRAYADRIGNGDIDSGDGWRYRGRGLKMTTGRGNYQDLQDNYHLVWPGNAPDFVENPDLLGTATYAVQAAVFFWIRHNLYGIADGGATDENVNSITRIINLHTRSYAARRDHFSRIWDAGVFSSVSE